MKFTDYFNPSVGDTKEQIVNRFEAMMDQLRVMAFKGYEHDPEKCTESTVVNGEKAGGWVDPKSGTCSTCGFYVGKVAMQIDALQGLLDQFKKLPPTYRYGVPNE